jgi:cellulose synthase/poly-beta-1,6-N-acetylglucosamine synthase-like glycosyltransferase
LIFLLIFFGIFSLVPALAWFSHQQKSNVNLVPKTVSIIIPARNEERDLGACLYSLLGQHYPKDAVEIIIVDDSSEDATAALVRKIIDLNPQFKIKLLELQQNEPGKKAALAAGIKEAHGEIIITRDADSVALSANWLASVLAPFEDEKVMMVTAPVKLRKGFSLLHNFEVCENFFLQLTGGGFAILGQGFLCNGANLAFRKKAFESVNGYEGNMELSSGDDIFLLEKIRKKFRSSLAHCNAADAFVEVSSSGGIREFFSQRFRWAGKFSLKLHPMNLFFAFSFFTIHVLFLILTVLSCVFAGWYKYLILCILIKWLIDILLLILASLRFRNWAWLPWFPLLEVMNLFYAIIIPVGSLFVRPHWKGRRI